MTLIPPGEVSPEHTKYPGELKHIAVTKPFYIGITEVTQEQWYAVMGTKPSCFSYEGSNKTQIINDDGTLKPDIQNALIYPMTGTSKFPVENISWLDALEFCNKLSKDQGLTACYII